MNQYQTDYLGNYLIIKKRKNQGIYCHIRPWGIPSLTKKKAINPLTGKIAFFNSICTLAKNRCLFQVLKLFTRYLPDFIVGARGFEPPTT